MATKKRYSEEYRAASSGPLTAPRTVVRLPRAQKRKGRPTEQGSPFPFPRREWPVRRPKRAEVVLCAAQE
jgi:hypothetical protein